MILRTQVQHTLKLRNSLVAACSQHRPRFAHGWSPIASAPLNNGTRLAFFDSLYVPPRQEDSSLAVNQALYGHLVVSAILNTALNTADKYSPESKEGGEPERNPGPQDSDEISDQEWELRTGRAIFILQQTLPDYFSKGLVSSVDIPLFQSDAPAESPSSGTGTWLKQALGLSDAADNTSGAEKNMGAAKAKREDDSASIYSPHVRLTYTPPTPLPAPFPKTLHVEGLHLYMASSVFLRHTLNAIYNDLHIELKRVRVEGAGTSLKASDSTSHKPRRISREKSFVVGLSILGTGRVSKAPTQWDVNCTYTFSPISGLILQHSIDSIEPAPTQALFEALGKFGLLGGGSGTPGGAGNMGPGATSTKPL